MTLTPPPCQFYFYIDKYSTGVQAPHPTLCLSLSFIRTGFFVGKGRGGGGGGRQKGCPALFWWGGGGGGGGGARNTGVQLFFPPFPFSLCQFYLLFARNAGVHGHGV